MHRVRPQGRNRYSIPDGSMRMSGFNRYRQTSVQRQADFFARIGHGSDERLAVFGEQIRIVDLRIEIRWTML
jgi:hypothetical protein